jgi:hypothetical protein
VTYKVKLSYFRQTGKFVSDAETTSTRETISEIWSDINDKRRLGQLPHLRPGTGRDLFVIVDVPDHPQRVLHMVTPPFLDEDDVTPSRTMTGEPALLVRVPLNTAPRSPRRRTGPPGQPPE